MYLEGKIHCFACERVPSYPFLWGRSSECGSVIYYLAVGLSKDSHRWRFHLDQLLVGGHRYENHHQSKHISLR